MIDRFTDNMPLAQKKKVINAWAFYDWANSVYNLTITSTIFPIYWTAVTSNGGTNRVNVFGMEFLNSALYSYAISCSFFLKKRYPYASTCTVFRVFKAPAISFQSVPYI